MNCERRGKAGRSDLHYFSCGHSLGNKLEVFAIDAYKFSIAAIDRFTEAAGIHKHLCTRLKCGVVRALDRTGEINAAVQRIATQDSSGTGRGQRIFVVDCRVTDPDDNIAGRQIIDVELLKSRDDLAVFLVYSICAKLIHAQRRLFPALSGVD